MVALYDLTGISYFLTRWFFKQYIVLNHVFLNPLQLIQSHLLARISFELSGNSILVYVL